MEEKNQCSECELPIAPYKQTDPPEGRDDICEFCHIASLNEDED